MKNNFFVHGLWSFPFLWRALQPLALDVRPEVWKGVVSASAFWVSFCILFSGGHLCPKTNLKNLGHGQGLQKATAISLMLCMLVTYITTGSVRQEYLRNKVCPRRPSASRKHVSYVPLKVQEGVTFLPIEPMFQGGITPKSFACSLAQVY